MLGTIHRALDPVLTIVSQAIDAQTGHVTVSAKEPMASHVSPDGLQVSEILVAVCNASV
ncbi:hypothetical protein CRM22_001915, partial [Opisthorchis felineus]